MPWYHVALLVGALGAAYLAWEVPRAVFWLSLLALSFVASSLWHDAGLPFGAAFGAGTNLIICFMLYAWAERRYEMRVWNCLHLMLVIDVLYMLGSIKSHYLFALSLEVANWLAILVIGVAGTLERAGYGIASRRARLAWVDRLHSALYEKRSRPPFWHVD